jgi:myo-inositol-1-phosphate synthase
MGRIKIAIVGVGNCASALVQGLYYYKSKRAEDAIGIMHWDIGGYTPETIEVVAAFDIDQRKVGQDVNRAILAPPNCTTQFCHDLPDSGIQVQMGNILDGFSQHMGDYEAQRTFLPSDQPQPNQEKVVQILKHSGAQVMLNYLPVGSEQATGFYAECALAAGTAFINNIPVFIASDPVWGGGGVVRGVRCGKPGFPSGTSPLSAMILNPRSGQPLPTACSPIYLKNGGYTLTAPISSTPAATLIF